MPILPDLLRPGLDLVFCGTAPGAMSAARGAYYANPTNRFWPTLHATGLTPRRFRPDEAPALPALGIGLTDVCKHAFGQDSALRPEDFDAAGLRAKIEAVAPARLAFTSKRAAAAVLGRLPPYGLQPETIGITALWVLPSPSGAARRWWSDAPWHALAQAVLTSRR